MAAASSNDAERSGFTVSDTAHPGLQWLRIGLKIGDVPMSVGEACMFLDDEMEILRPDLPRGRFRSVLFDFDGTLSLIREGWPQVMIPMMVGRLREPARAKRMRS